MKSKSLPFGPSIIRLLLKRKHPPKLTLLDISKVYNLIFDSFQLLVREQMGIDGNISYEQMIKYVKWVEGL